MKIETAKDYKVTKYHANGDCSNLGILPGADVKKILRGYEFDEMFEMWYSKSANVGYDVKEVK